MKEPLVSVFMMAYNHEKYIIQAIDSILMQKVDFEYEIVIGEDCSTDQTRDILLSYKKKYPNKFNLLLHEKNVGAMKNQNAVLNACKGKYIAFCEGDDYWIDSNKLQKQVDFLEANSDYGLVYTNYKRFIDKSKQFETIVNNNKYSGNLLNELIINNFIGTLTVLLKKEFIVDLEKDCEDLFLQNPKIGDMILWIYLANKTKIHYIDDVTAVYRVLETSISNSINYDKQKDFFDEGYKIKSYFINKYSNNLKKNTETIYRE
ncbi:glycosyltransferase, partial [bacterium]|nr:glycosyltransferase [bacterium]